MAGPAPMVTIFGGSGFVGRYATQRLARAGWRVRVAVRRPNEALFVRPYGSVGQVEPVQANVRDDASVRAAIRGADAVVYAVGVLVETGKQSFDAVQREGAARVARIAAEEGARRLVLISAIGADPNSDSLYARSKAEGEAAVREAFSDAVILRPSVIFGVEDEFFNRFAAMARILPVLPIVGPETRFQPVYVDDVATAVAKAVVDPVPAGIYELGGPEAVSFRELMRRMLRMVERRRPILALPWGVARLQAKVFDQLQRISFGLFTNTLITRDQLKQLARDNVVAEGAKGFAELGIRPVAMDVVLESYLFRYRRTGQYAKMANAAKKIRQE